MTVRTTHARAFVALHATRARARRAPAPVRNMPKPTAALEAATYFSRPPLRDHIRTNVCTRPLQAAPKAPSTGA